MSSRKQIGNTLTITTMDDPVSVQAQYSPDKVTVHTTWQNGDLYMRTRESDDAAWSSWHKIVGENGGETDYAFNISKSKTSANVTTAPSDCYYTQWQDAPKATTTIYPYLWSKVQKKDGNGNNVGSATYIRLTGEEGKDGLSPNPNILLRTVFDRGIDKVKEKWDADWDYVSIDGASGTIISGRKSIRINLSSASTYKDFKQNVYGRIQPSTWYTLSFNYFATQDFQTFIYDGANTYGVVDRTAGYYIDGVYNSGDLGIDGNHTWPKEWQGKRHSITFKTKSSFGTTTANIIFRTQSGAQTAICMPKLEIGKDATTYIANEDDLVGDKGESITGPRGKTGRFYYYAQEWSSDPNVSYAVTDAEAPYFLYRNKYWVFNPTDNGTYSMQAMGTPSSSSTNWKLMVTDFKFIITEAIFGSYAHFGSAIINGDWMISTNGTIDGVAKNNGTNYTYNGETKPAYMWFDPTNPNENTGHNFIPNYAIDLLTGEAWLNIAHIRGVVYATSGKFTGEIESQSGRIGGFNIGTSNLTAINGSLNVTPNGVEFRPSNGSVAWLGATDNIIGAFYAKMTSMNNFACGAQFGAEGASILNAAIDITKGVVSGYVPVVMEFSTNITIVCNNDVNHDSSSVKHVRSGGVFLPLGNSNLTVTLPLSPANGTQYTFVKTNQANTVISCQGTNKIAVNQKYQDAGTSYTLSAYARLTLIYSNGYWYGNT